MAIPLSPLPPLRDVIARYDLGARKSLGQHFLLDSNLTDRIVRSADLNAVDTVLEVGPGPGGLTRSLLATDTPHIVSVERDNRCIQALEELSAQYPNRLRIVEDDALKVDERNLLPEGSAIVANLPYNVGTALLFKWLDAHDHFCSMTLLFQKEVADRIAADVGSKAYGRLAVMAQWRCKVKKLFDIPARAFTPPPKVMSTLIQLVPRGEVLAPADAETLSLVVKTAFGQRRKMLRSSLKSLSQDPESLLSRAGIDGRQRAEQLSIPEFCAISAQLRQMRGEEAQ